MVGVFQGFAPPTKENTLYHAYKIPTIKEKLVAHIILILGKAGKKAHYSVDKGLNLTLNLSKVSKNLSTTNADKNLEKTPLNSHQNFIKEGEFLNSTHCLLESFENASYTLIATRDAFKFQCELFDKHCPKIAAILRRVAPVLLDEKSEFEDIFHQILQAIKNAPQNELVILDITHGFRYQPIIASFASILGSISAEKSVQIIFAKPLDIINTRFCYVSLQRYTQISLIALALSTFLQTLSLPHLVLLDNNEPLLRSLWQFSRAIHANTPNLELLNQSLNELKLAQKSPNFDGLESILDELEAILREFESILQSNEYYEKFYKFAQFMLKKGFYLIAATYISETLGLFMLFKFENAGFINPKNAKLYDKITAVKNFVFYICDKNGVVKLQSKTETLFTNINLAKKCAKAQIKDFEYLKDTMVQIADFRNHLVHLSAKQNPQSTQRTLQSVLDKFKNTIFQAEFLKDFNA